MKKIYTLLRLQFCEYSVNIINKAKTKTWKENRFWTIQIVIVLRLFELSPLSYMINSLIQIVEKHLFIRNIISACLQIRSYRFHARSNFFLFIMQYIKKNWLNKSFSSHTGRPHKYMRFNVHMLCLSMSTCIQTFTAHNKSCVTRSCLFDFDSDRNQFELARAADSLRHALTINDVPHAFRSAPKRNRKHRFCGRA